MKIIKSAYSLIFCALLGFTSCEVSVQKAPSLRNTKVETYYIGHIPCPDCEEIETIIELKKNQTYVFNRRYLGKENNIQFETVGRFNWLKDGTIIHLLDLDGPSYYKADSEKLIQLEDDLRYKIGPYPNSYYLMKDALGSTAF